MKTLSRHTRYVDTLYSVITNMVLELLLTIRRHHDSNMTNMRNGVLCVIKYKFGPIGQKFKLNDTKYGIC